MKKRKGFLILFLLIVLSCATLYWYNTKYKADFAAFKTTEAYAMQLNPNDNIHFFSQGFVVSGEKIKFYNQDGGEIGLPISQTVIQEPLKELIATHSSESYIVFNNMYLFNTNNIPFELINKFDSDEVWAIKEFKDLLLILLKDNLGNIKPITLRINTKDLAPVEVIGNTAFLDASYHSASKKLSILNLDLDSNQPSSRLFHYDEKIIPFGAFSAFDKLYYYIYRLSSHFLLIGSRDVLCYNIDGSIIWETTVPYAYRHQIINHNNNLVLYFNDQNINNTQYNSMIINEKAEYTYVGLPRGLTNIQLYKNKILALEGDNVLVLTNFDGKNTQKTRMDFNVKNLFVFPSDSKNIYMISKKNKLYIFPPRKDGL